MIYAVIENGLVVNVILLEDADKAAYVAATGSHVEKCNDDVAIGWAFVDGQFVVPEV